MLIMQPGHSVGFITPSAGSDPSSHADSDSPPRTGVEDLKVMVVDDEFLAAWHLQSMLEDMGIHQIELAHDGPSALQLAEKLEPDLVLMDMNLGAGIDGAETARRLLDTRPVRLIFITAYGDQGTLDRIRAAAPGADILIKPANPGRLQQLVLGRERH